MQAYTSELYEKYIRIIETFLTDNVVPDIRLSSGTVLLTKFSKWWGDFKTAVRFLSHVFSYIVDSSRTHMTT